MTLGTSCAGGLGICACAAALLTLHHMGDAHFLLDALARLHKINGHIAVDVAATPGRIGIGRRSGAAATAAESAAKDAVENVAYITESAKAAESACTSAAAIVGVYAGMTELDISGTLIRI